MRVGVLIGAAGAIAAVPGFALLVLILSGAAAPGPAMLALLATLAAAAGLGFLVARDLERLTGFLAEAAEPEESGRRCPDPGLPPLENLARGIERLVRTRAARATQVGQLLRANETIIESLPDPLVVLDGDGKMKRANAAARLAYGTDMPAVLRHPGVRAAIDRALTSGTQQSVELTLPVPVTREVHATVIKMEVPLANSARAMVVLSDRTRERAVERTRADFVANASHELRTPLASLIGFIDTLRGPAADDPQAQQRFLGIMAEQAQRMNRLIDDLLSLSRIELTEHQPPAERVNLVTLAERVVAGFEPTLASRSVTLALTAGSDLPAVIADTDQMTQVVQNLVDNAVKYGRDGGKVEVRLAAVAPGGRWPARQGVVLSVVDDGPGIPHQHIPRLTERFYRVDTGRSRRAGGTGLGLAIVKHVVNRHRGQFLIESELGRGSSFSVWLPVAADS
ncbi:Phosphate regulon sensor protein PhoR [Rhodovastum atsumiense]|uniref:histidine kinase n=1 Tax=Rhodovastum atsumiense TaxID=504468 RepID=A0A5M6IZ77_9PROT|nr:ATP-binding protein [Rhodovastum atsumiense]KAA5613644.1 two-component sensor histidine kinase [Rhodovastum atsumiense]CAH2599551.1 Phosphate regulon sensor protein PhoR [Rhodovastum atsumiense]